MHSHNRQHHPDHCELEGPMIPSPLSNLKVNKGARNKSERRSPGPGTEIKLFAQAQFSAGLLNS